MPPTMSTSIPEERISLTTWKQKERTSLNISSNSNFITGVSILKKLRKFSDLSPLSAHLNHPKNLNSTWMFYKKFNTSTLSDGTLKFFLWYSWPLPSLLDAWLKSELWASYALGLLKSWLDGWGIRWLTAEIKS